MGVGIGVDVLVGVGSGVFVGVGVGVYVGSGSGTGVSVGSGVCVAVGVNVAVTVNVGVRVNLGGRCVAALSMAPASAFATVAADFASRSAGSTTAVSISPSELHATKVANTPLSTIATAKKTPRRAQELYLCTYNIPKG